MLLAIFILTADLGLLAWLLIRQQQNQQTIMADINQTLAELRELKSTTAKIFGEVSGKLGELTGKIAELEERLANQQVPDEVTALIAEIRDGLKTTDDLIPDAPAPETPAS